METQPTESATMTPVDKDFPKSFKAALARLRTRAKKAAVIDDVRKVGDAVYRAYEKARAETSWPADRELLERMNAAGEAVRQSAFASMEAAEAEYRAEREAEIRRLKDEHREQQRKHWSNL